MSTQKKRIIVAIIIVAMCLTAAALVDANMLPVVAATLWTLAVLLLALAPLFTDN